MAKPKPAGKKRICPEKFTLPQPWRGKWLTYCANDGRPRADLAKGIVLDFLKAQPEAAFVPRSQS